MLDGRLGTSRSAGGEVECGQQVVRLRYQEVLHFSSSRRPQHQHSQRQRQHQPPTHLGVCKEKKEKTKRNIQLYFRIFLDQGEREKMTRMWERQEERKKTRN
jgi:hypothetical protein